VSGVVVTGELTGFTFVEFIKAIATIVGRRSGFGGRFALAFAFRFRGGIEIGTDRRKMFDQ